MLKMLIWNTYIHRIYIFPFFNIEITWKSDLEEKDTNTDKRGHMWKHQHLIGEI